MSGIIFGVEHVDPVSGERAFMADFDWDLGEATVIADHYEGRVVVAPRGPWQYVPQEAVEQAREATKQATMDSEIRNMLEGKENP